jgi:hypothetical protein
VKEPFDSPGWIFETKLDGYRAIAVIESTGKARIWSRNRLPFKQKFTMVLDAVDQLKAALNILDGEIDTDGALSKPLHLLISDPELKCDSHSPCFLVKNCRPTYTITRASPTISRPAAYSRLICSFRFHAPPTLNAISARPPRSCGVLPNSSAPSVNRSFSSRSKTEPPYQKLRRSGAVCHQYPTSP